ncbi:MAG: hypothetical protein HKP41_16460 [Desulfobacterales bacterium]|nr:hypothetical protein [Deltaproteobacteria bacterium]MBT8361335.1 hypothetical protein [Deltaproteobacteria bacterium]NNK95943.1 hypothetical protein [Desulfobacterales bacterium]
MIDIGEVIEKVTQRSPANYKATVIRWVFSIFVDLIIALVVFILLDRVGIVLEFGLIKIFAAVLLIDIVKHIIDSVGESLSYRFALKRALKDEMKHYMIVLRDDVFWTDPDRTYEDFLYEIVSNDTNSEKNRLLAAIQYGSVLTTILNNAKYEKRYHKLYLKCVPERMLLDL